MAKRLMAAGLLLAIAGGSAASSAGACAVPIESFDRARAVAILHATVAQVSGRDRRAVYDVRATAVVRPAPVGIAMPRRLLIVWADYDHGMCGSNGVPLRAGDRVVLYFGLQSGMLHLGGWKKTGS